MTLKNKIYDCVTFFDENLIVNSRFEILKDVVDYFVVVESNYDHKGNKKRINFKLQNKKFKDRVRHIVIEKNFPNLENVWDIESFQRERIYEGINDSSENDYIMYSDSDEIPNPKIIRNLNLNKKYGIFLQSFFVYKINIFNEHETPWEGTRICKKKNLKSIDWMRSKVLSKNLKYGFWRIDKEKNIELINEGGWHFNYLLKPNEISKKFKSLAETSWDKEEYFNEENIIKKIDLKKDLFNRGHTFDVVKINDSYPEYIKGNKDKYQDWIIK